MDKTAEDIFMYEVRKVLQSVALHGYDLICAESDIIKANKKYHEAKLKEELIKYDKWYWGQRGDSEKEVDKYLKQRNNG
jgi:hypothetical protein